MSVARGPSATSYFNYSRCKSAARSNIALAAGGDGEKKNLSKRLGQGPCALGLAACAVSRWPIYVWQSGVVAFWCALVCNYSIVMN